MFLIKIQKKVKLFLSSLFSQSPQQFLPEFLVKRTDSNSKLLFQNSDSSNSDQQKTCLTLKLTDFHPKKISDFGKPRKNESILNSLVNSGSLCTPSRYSSKKHIPGLREQVIRRNMFNNEEEGNQINLVRMNNFLI